MKVCARCGVESPEETLFCQQCGEPLAQGSVAVAEDSAPESAETHLAGEQPSAVDVSAESAALPMPENVAAVIAYITPIPAAVFLFLKPFRDNLFVRFHAFQHIFVFAAGLAFMAAAALVGMLMQLIPSMRVLIFPFMGLAALAWFFLWLLLVVKAYHHEMFKLPYIGDYAEEWSLKK